MTSQHIDALGRAVPAFRFGTTHKKAYSGASVQIDDPVSDECSLVLVWASTDCHIAVGENPTATTGDKPITAKVDVPVVINPGHKIAVIRQQIDGELWVTELL